jgi:Tol biopolymer transport system component
MKKLLITAVIAIYVSVECTFAFVQRISLDVNGNEGNNVSDHESISADGRYIAFQSQADNLVSGDTNNATDIFVRDTLSGTIQRVSVASG